MEKGGYKNIVRYHSLQLPMKGFKFDVRSFQLLDLKIFLSVTLIGLLQLLQTIGILERSIDFVEPSLKLFCRPNRNFPIMGVI